MPTPLESKLKYTFRDPILLKLALTHSSWGHEQKKKLPHNERLEFLGDAVLELVISEHLYRLYPDTPEGWLTKVRAHFVNRSSLVKIAKSLDLGSHLVLGEAEVAQGGRERASNLANVMEAIIGAIFLDSDYVTVREFVVRQIQPRLKEISDNPEPENAKGVLQEKLHISGEKAIYRIVSEVGPPHQKEFQATVEVNGQVFGTGTGHTKKEAETQAATVALNRIGNDK